MNHDVEEAADDRSNEQDIEAGEHRHRQHCGTALSANWRRRVGIEPTLRRFRAETTVLKTAEATRPHSPPSSRAERYGKWFVDAKNFRLLGCVREESDFHGSCFVCGVHRSHGAVERDLIF